MKKVKFDNNEIFSSAWKMIKKKFAFLLAVVSVSIVVTFVPNFTSEFLKKDYHFLSNIFLVAGYIIQFIVGMGMMRIALRLIDSGKPKLDELFSCARLFPRYFLATVCYFLLITGGLIILGLIAALLPGGRGSVLMLVAFLLWIVPGVILSLRFGMYSYFIVDRDAGPIESLKLSSRLTQGNKYRIMIFGFWISLFVLGVFVTVGLIVGIPTVFLAFLAMGKLWVVSQVVRIIAAVLAALFLFIGLCLFIAGLCLASMLMMMSYAFLYRKLLGEKGV